jgi:tRNA 2-thiouridine synthesizing protein E
MQTQTYAGQTIAVNEEGFLLDSRQWTPAIAEALAVASGVALTSEHWQVITFCRNDAAKTGQSPGLRRISLFSGVGMKDLRLFPGPGKHAKIAGFRTQGLP